MSKCNLRDLYGELAAGIYDPKFQDNNGFIFTPSNLPKPPASFKSDRLILKKSQHVYSWSVGESLADSLILYSTRETLRHMGLWILSMMFHNDPPVSKLVVTHVGSDIKEIQCHYDHSGTAWGEDIIGYRAMPSAFEYLFEPPSRHPFLNWENSPNELPHIFVTDEDGFADNEHAEPEACNRVLGFGKDRASIRFASLLLDIGGSTSDDPNLDIDLEGEMGFRGISPGSVELAIVTPGTHRWQAVAAIDPGFGR